ncbi:hypothetical protein [Bartonella quintana]|uniref:hypothetical protein n=1 Tax=Bartonella quintana TaxID=803 RepID=UPI00054D6E02|nr:hypothetical protein [Bartonella quintana]
MQAASQENQKSSLLSESKAKECALAGNFSSFLQTITMKSENNVQPLSLHRHGILRSLSNQEIKRPTTID